MNMAQLSVVFGLPHIAVVKWTAFQRVCRLVVLCATTESMFWMMAWSLCLLVLLGSFTSRGLGLGGDMLVVAGWRGRVLLRMGLGVGGGRWNPTGGWRGGA